MTKPAIKAALRHVAAAAISIYGVLSASVGQLHLPPAVSGVLTASYPILLALEHYAARQTGPAPVVQAFEAIPEIKRLAAEAKTDFARFVNDARVYLEASLPAPAAAPVVAPAPAAVPVAPSAPVTVNVGQ